MTTTTEAGGMEAGRAMSLPEMLAGIRAAGWSVGVHNDYRLGGEPHTFWLFTHPGGQWIKGEGKTDEEAVRAAFGDITVAAFGLKPATARPDESNNWRDDPSADERWNAGLDYGMTQLCAVLEVDPQSINWDAATETLDGDVQSVLLGILRAKLGEDFAARPSQAAGVPVITEDMIEAGCRAAAEAHIPGVEASMQPTRLKGRSIISTDWKSYRYLIEPALKAALDRDTIPAGHVERVRHLKRGTEYEVLHRGVELQISTQDYQSAKACREGCRIMCEGERLVIYQGSDGKLWAREEAEFDDGRFVRLDRAAAPQSEEA